MKNLDKAFKNTQEERYLLADLILRKLNDKKLLQILNMGHKTSDKNTLKELISMSTHPYLTWFLSSKLSMITGVPRNKMSATMMYNPKKGKDMRMMRRNPRIYERELLVELEDKKDAIQEQLNYMLSEHYTENEMMPYILEWERLMDRITDLKEELNIIDSGMETKRNPSHDFDSYLNEHGWNFSELNKIPDNKFERVVFSETFGQSIGKRNVIRYVFEIGHNLLLEKSDSGFYKLYEPTNLGLKFLASKEIPPKTKRNPSHEEHRDTMRKLYDMAKASARGTLDVRLLDIAHGAVRIDELDHVLEQCDDKKVCDYAAYKKAFFIDKKMTKSNPMSRKGIRDIRGTKKPSDGILHSKNKSGDGRFTGLNSILGLSDSEIREILKKELNERFFATTKIGAIDYIKEVEPIGLANFRKKRKLAIEVKGTLKKLYVEVGLNTAGVRVFNYSVKSKNPESGTVEAEIFYDLEDINELLEEIHKMCLMSHSGTVFRERPNF